MRLRRHSRTLAQASVVLRKGGCPLAVYEHSGRLRKISEALESANLVPLDQPDVYRRSEGREFVEPDRSAVWRRKRAMRGESILDVYGLSQFPALRVARSPWRPSIYASRSFRNTGPGDRPRAWNQTQGALPTRPGSAVWEEACGAGRMERREVELHESLVNRIRRGRRRLLPLRHDQAAAVSREARPRPGDDPDLLASLHDFAPDDRVCVGWVGGFSAGADRPRALVHGDILIRGSFASLTTQTRCGSRVTSPRLRVPRTARRSRPDLRSTACSARRRSC